MTALQQLIDRAEIIDTLICYHRAVDRADWALLRRAVFTEDAVWELVASDAQGEVRDSVTGLENIIRWLEPVVAGATTRHMMTSHLLDVDGNAAQTESYMVALDRRTLETIACGLVTAESVRIDRWWKIRRLRIEERVVDGSASAVARLFGLSTNPSGSHH